MIVDVADLEEDVTGEVADLRYQLAEAQETCAIRCGEVDGR